MREIVQTEMTVVDLKVHMEEKEDMVPGGARILAWESCGDSSVDLRAEGLSVTSHLPLAFPRRSYKAFGHLVLDVQRVRTLAWSSKKPPKPASNIHQMQRGEFCRADPTVRT